MADLTTQLADLNANAKNLLQKYDGAFSKIENLSEQKQKELSDFVSKQVEVIKNSGGNIDIDKIKKEIDDKVASAIKEINDSLEKNKNNLNVYSKQFNTSVTNITDTDPLKIDELSFDSFNVKANYAYFVLAKLASAQGMQDDDGNRCRLHMSVKFGDTMIAGTVHEFHHNGWEIRDIVANGVYIATENKTIDVTTNIWQDSGDSVGFNWHGWDEQISSIIIVEVKHG